MNVEEKIDECEFYLNQIKHFEPDPYYVNYFFRLFIKSADKAYDKIFEEADTEFGLFVLGNCNKKKFYEKALLKKDEKALEFVNWFENKIKNEHKPQVPNFMKKVIKFQNKNRKLPKIKIMIRAKERYPKDINQEILIDLVNGKLKSREELEIEIKRQIPMFLEIINKKRSSCSEPKVNQKQVTASTFMQIKENEEYDIVNACEIYISVLKRILIETREEINKKTEFR